LRKKYTLLLLPLLFSTGCTTEYFIREFMDGPKTCQPSEMNAVVQNRRAIQNVRNGYNMDYARSIMASDPKRTDALHMANGEVYYVDHFQVEPGLLCYGELEHGEFEQVYYFNNIVVGKGDYFYESSLAPYITSKEFDY
jgi:hypothetical protein